MSARRLPGSVPRLTNLFRRSRASTAARPQTIHQPTMRQMPMKNVARKIMKTPRNSHMSTSYFLKPINRPERPDSGGQRFHYNAGARSDSFHMDEVLDCGRAFCFKMDFFDYIVA